MSLAILLCVLGFALVCRTLVRRHGRVAWRHRWPLLLALLGAGACLSVTLTNIAISNRYLGDFYPVVSLASAIAVALIAERIDDWPRWWDRLFVMGCIVGIAWGVAVNWALYYRNFQEFFPTSHWPL